MKLKQGWITIMVVLAVFTFANAVHANTIALIDSGNRYSNGGPFTAKVIEILPDGLVGDPITTGGIQFTTFCLEKTEYFYGWNTPYSYTIAPYAVGGSGNHDLTTPGKDYLDPKSAYLYYNFRINPVAYNQKALQAAFWYIEDELIISSPALGSLEALALSYVTAAAVAGWQTIGPVVVLNLYDTQHGNLQSQLGLMAVPEPATMFLLGFGLFGLAGISRKLKK